MASEVPRSVLLALGLGAGVATEGCIGPCLEYVIDTADSGDSGDSDTTSDASGALEAPDAVDAVLDGGALPEDVAEIVRRRRG